MPGPRNCWVYPILYRAAVGTRGNTRIGCLLTLDLLLEVLLNPKHERLAYKNGSIPIARKISDKYEIDQWKSLIGFMSSKFFLTLERNAYAS